MTTDCVSYSYYGAYAHKALPIESPGCLNLVADDVDDCNDDSCILPVGRCGASSDHTCRISFRINDDREEVVAGWWGVSSSVCCKGAT